MTILLDTHAVLWWQAGGQRLSQRASREIARADRILVSPISCWEIVALLGRGKIALDREVYTWTRDLFAEERVEVAPLSPQSAVRAGLLGRDGFHGNPADRLLYATAEELVVPFVTKDSAVREHSRQHKEVRTVW